MPSPPISASSNLDLEDLVNLEQTFFDAGYKEGHAHGRLQGLVEGRTLGREKGFELWEEVGFYEGFAKVWAAACPKHDSHDHAVASRTEHHIRHLLELVAAFPRVNPSSLPQDGTEKEADVMEQLSKIRARYKALCATLGVKPRLRRAGLNVTAATDDFDDQADAPPKKKQVWALDGQRPDVSQDDFSF